MKYSHFAVINKTSFARDDLKHHLWPVEGDKRQAVFAPLHWSCLSAAQRGLHHYLALHHHQEMKGGWLDRSGERRQQRNKRVRVTQATGPTIWATVLRTEGAAGASWNDGKETKTFDAHFLSHRFLLPLSFDSATPPIVFFALFSSSATQYSIPPYFPPSSSSNLSSLLFPSSSSHGAHGARQAAIVQDIPSLLMVSCAHTEDCWEKQAASSDTRRRHVLHTHTHKQLEASTSKHTYHTTPKHIHTTMNKIPAHLNKYAGDLSELFFYCKELVVTTSKTFEKQANLICQRLLVFCTTMKCTQSQWGLLGDTKTSPGNKAIAFRNLSTGFGNVMILFTTTVLTDGDELPVGNFWL